MAQASRLCFLDLETTGLDEQRDEVLEVGAIFGAFDGHRFVEAERIEAVFPPILKHKSEWDPFVQDMHSTSGLIGAIAGVANGIPDGPGTSRYMQAVHTRVLGIDTQLMVAARRLFGDEKVALAGNTVHFDLRFVRRAFPTFAARLSHRVLDVSAIKILLEGMGRSFEKTDAHRAIADCEASIKELEACAAWIAAGKEK